MKHPILKITPIFRIVQARSWSLGALMVLSLCIGGCGQKGQPDAIWLETGTGRGQVVYPRAIAFDHQSNEFYICDRSAHIQRIDAKGKYLADWHTPANANGKPVGLTVGPDANLYVPDTHYFQIIVYDRNGNELKRIGSLGDGPGQFKLVTDIAFDPAGLMYVSEYDGNDRIQVFDKSLHVVRTIGRFGNGDGEFSRPQSMVIANDLLYVTDACNHRIVVFKLDGSFVRNIGSVGSELGQFRFPYGLDMDRKGRLVVCEFGNNRVQLIDPQSGRGIATWGRAGRDPGELAYPWAVAVDDAGRIVTVDSGNNRIQVFRF